MKGGHLGVVPLVVGEVKVIGQRLLVARKPIYIQQLNQIEMFKLVGGLFKCQLNHILIKIDRQLNMKLYQS